MATKNKKSQNFYVKSLKCILSSWWVVCFLVVTYCLGLKSFEKKEHSIAGLKAQVSLLANQKTLATQKKLDLEKKIISHKDPAYVEMILMKNLGVVPEGYVKISFKKASLDTLTFYEEL